MSLYCANAVNKHIQHQLMRSHKAYLIKRKITAKHQHVYLRQTVARNKFSIKVRTVNTGLYAPFYVKQNILVGALFPKLYKTLVSLRVKFLQINKKNRIDVFHHFPHFNRDQHNFMDRVLGGLVQFFKLAFLVLQLHITKLVHQVILFFVKLVNGLFRHAQLPGNIIHGYMLDPILKEQLQ